MNIFYCGHILEYSKKKKKKEETLKLPDRLRISANSYSTLVLMPRPGIH